MAMVAVGTDSAGVFAVHCAELVARKVGLMIGTYSKWYLGDAVYAGFDGEYLILTTEDGIKATNTVMLEPCVLAELQRYIEYLKNIKPEEHES
jgi:hypothetical protein